MCLLETLFVSRGTLMTCAIMPKPRVIYIVIMLGVSIAPLMIRFHFKV